LTKNYKNTSDYRVKDKMKGEISRLISKISDPVEREKMTKNFEIEIGPWMKLKRGDFVHSVSRGRQKKTKKSKRSRKSKKSRKSKRSRKYSKTI